jgi:GxxExxY protein
MENNKAIPIHSFVGKHAEMTQQILGAFYKVYNQLGYGFLEKVYENALVIELNTMGLEAEAQSPIEVYYSGQLIGQYFADILVNKQVIVEIKTSRQINEEYEAQLLNYLKATPVEVGLLINFGPKPDFRRKIFDNERKVNLSAAYILKNDPSNP